MAEKVFPKGITIFTPSEKAKKFSKGTLIITPKILTEWLKGDGSAHMTEYKGDKQIKISIKEGKEGKLYLEVQEDYKKKEEDGGW